MPARDGWAPQPLGVDHLVLAVARYHGSLTEHHGPGAGHRALPVRPLPVRPVPSPLPIGRVAVSVCSSGSDIGAAIIEHGCLTETVQVRCSTSARGTV